MPLLGAVVVIGSPPSIGSSADDYPHGGGSIPPYLAAQSPKFARGTVPGSPPVQALNWYQAGLASRSSVSRPAESQNWQALAWSVHENHQTPSMCHEARLATSIAIASFSSRAWPRGPRSQ